MDYGLLGSSSYKLTEATIAKLKEQDIDSLETLCALEECDIKELQLNVGQRALLRKSILLLVKPAELQTVDTKDDPHMATTKSLAKDKDLNKLLSDINMLPGILAYGDKQDTSNANDGYNYEGNVSDLQNMQSKIRKKSLRICDFVTEDLDAGDEDEEEVARVNGGKLVMRRSSKPKVSELTLPEWIPANARILMDLIDRHEISTMDEVKQYLDHTIKIGDFARENYINSVMRYDEKFRRMQAEKSCRWDTNDPFLMHNNLIKRTDAKYGQRQNTKPREEASRQVIVNNNGKRHTYDASGCPICHLYQSTKGCHLPGCTYSHVCIIPGCGGAHPSCQHYMQEGPL